MSIKNKLNQKADELTLLLKMVGASDDGGLDAVAFLAEQIADLCSKHSSFTSLIEMANSLCESRSSVTNEEFIVKARNLAQQIPKHLDNSEEDVVQENTTTKHSLFEFELDENFDGEFVELFIEQSNSMLDELDTYLATTSTSPGSLSEEKKAQLHDYVFKYLHNLKGSSGSIGLNGVCQVAHQMEDAISRVDAWLLFDLFLRFRDWLRDNLDSLTSTGHPKGNSREFLETIAEQINLLLSQLEEPPEPSGNKPQPTLPTSYKITTDLNMFSEFRAEAQDHLAEIENILLSNPDELSAEEIDTIFRTVHSLKGASSYFNLLEINQTSHLLESILDEVRDDKRTFTEQLRALVFEYIDLEKELLASGQIALENDTDAETIERSKEYILQLNNFVSGNSSQPEPNKQAAVIDEYSGPTVHAHKLNLKSFVKVDTARLDSLVEAIGEMVIYSSMLIKQSQELIGENDKILSTSRQVQKFSKELQDIGMSMRLDPVKSLFQKMSRVVMDTSRKLDKDIELQIEGEETELDRNLMEKLADPLMHMVRNALDHGIETVQERTKLGKPPRGRITLKAAHVGGDIQITIEDDGRGIDPNKLINAAIEKGIISSNQNLTEQETFQLIFAPGFSTAETVTSISGRGVGMDVVRNNIASLRGDIFVSSTLGASTTFTITLPLTLAIIDGVEARLGKERFIFPTLSIVEFMRPTTEMFSLSQDSRESFCFRGEQIPFYRLGHLFDSEESIQDPSNAIVLILEYGNDLLAIMVDEIVGRYQTVIKNLGPLFSKELGIAGCAIMPNGEVGLVLDLRSLVTLARGSSLPNLDENWINLVNSSKEDICRNEV